MVSFNRNDSIKSISSEQSSSVESMMSGKDSHNFDSPCCSKNIIRTSIDCPLMEEPSSSSGSLKSVSEFPKSDSSSSKVMVHQPVVEEEPVVKENEEVVVPKVKASVACTAQGSPSNVVISGADEETKDLVLKNSQTMSAPPTVPPVIPHVQLIRISLVLPMVVKKPLFRYFKVIQNQNEGLKTGKWTVTKQTVLEPNSPEYDCNVIYTEVENRVTVICIDKESAEYLKRAKRIKFMFWKLPINFKPTL